MTLLKYNTQTIALPLSVRLIAAVLVRVTVTHQLNDSDEIYKGNLSKEKPDTNLARLLNFVSSHSKMKYELAKDGLSEPLDE